MRIKISEYKYGELLEAKGNILLDSRGSIYILKDFKIETIERKRKWRKCKNEFYLIDCTFYGFNSERDFIGTSTNVNEELLFNFDFIEGLNKWAAFKKQLDKFKKDERTSQFFKNEKI